ncbi:ABC transporter ATP-binding protein [Colwellia sp. 4_MG-2023]|uniref:ABC transporter ATP-binding protein n=1 Tax=unclassified Colwellia TaxID=196834 RepID=UPI001C09643D|nr:MULTISPECIES: ABC transporter ATP-binding protein [unclassified Colwellia]MBU2925447.1 ABC transporter ATP-binding protein [Colwellia sp. C2M11]MDO6486527.1 ABC transporter ATP-binding protein [Colwellia sp. 6_MG-2023]MDO6506405.1 ABC transporter ATP-binding protein [Colwellia sp. 5_MG-2023]MDO6555229.1 ABC transporter ATP-binding protein [Colwellia sp. 4_MG-2023]MDO6651585.1 ABC transporter ATP-binding protein [Colwellia sp. 3_MG-2023]
MSVLLKVHQLHWQVNNKAILNNISFNVSKGEVIGIIGPNGAGKTSLLRCITNQQQHNKTVALSGSVHLKNKIISGYSARELARNFANVTQKAEAIFSLTVLDIVRMGLLPFKGLFAIDNDHDKQQIKLALEKVGLSNTEKMPYSQLSGGEQQRVLIARALVQKAQILILDEPTNHLDVYYQHQVLNLVNQLNITVIMTVHDLNLASQYCQRLLLLEQGKLIADGTPEQVLTQTQLSKVFRLPCSIIKDDLQHKPRVFFSLPEQQTINLRNKND